MLKDIKAVFIFILVLFITRPGLFKNEIKNKLLNNAPIFIDFY